MCLPCRSAISSSILAIRALDSLLGLFLQCFRLDLEAHDLAAGLFERGRHVLERDAQGGSGLVDEIDDFVGQEAIGDITAGQVDRGDDSVVGDLHAVDRARISP